MYFRRVLAILFLLILQLPLCHALPEKPSVDGIDVYFAEEIDRTWSFLQTRPNHPELILKMAVLLEETGFEKQAEPWFEELKALNLPQSQIEEINAKIRRQYRFSSVPIFKPKENLPTRPGIEEDTPSSSSGENMVEAPGPDAAALAAEAANDMKRAAKEYLQLYKRAGKVKYLALAAERFLWANQSHRALPLLMDLRNLRPNDQALLLKIAEIYGWHGDNQKKVIFLEQALNLKYRRSIHKKLVAALSVADADTRTSRNAESYLERYPNDTDVKVILAESLFKQRKDEQAFRILKELKLKELDSAQIVALVPAIFYAKGYAEVATFCQKLSNKKASILAKINMHYYHAAARLELKDLAGSEKLVLAAEKVLESKNFHTDAAVKNKLKLDFLLLKARILKELDRLDQLLKVHKTILELNPAQFESLVFLGEAFRNQDNPEISQHYFEQALKLEPDNRYLIWSLAEIAVSRKNLPRARLLIEKLQQMPDFKDEAMLLGLWKETGAWKKLAEYIGADSQRLLPDYRAIYLEALSNLGKDEIVAKMSYEQLAKNPFDDDAEKRLFKTASRIPGFLADYQSQKAIWVNSYHQSLIDTISEKIDAEPENKTLLEERARIYGYMNRPDLALKDLCELLKTSGTDLPLFEHAAAMAEWASDKNQAISLRKKIFQADPGNASNSIRLASLALSQRRFVDADNYLEASTDMESIDFQAYFSTALPILMQSGRFSDAHELVSKIKNSSAKDSKNNDFAKSRVEYARIFGRDIGPVNRLGFSFLHDTDNVSLANLQYFSRFNVRNHSFFEAKLEDLAMNRDNANQMGIRARIFSFGGNLVYADKRISCYLPILFNENNKLHLFAPAISYRTYRPNHEIAFDFNQSPVRDTPEALRQGLFSNNFKVTYRQKAGNSSWIQGNAGIRKNSAGYSGSFAGITLEKNLSYEPFRSVSYTFNTEDNQTENSDLFYLEDFIQSHTLAYTGQSDFYHAGRLIDSINWDIFTGLNNRSESFYGASIRLERSAGRKYFFNVFANYYSSKNNRFEQAGGYKNWNYGISLEKREW